MSWCEWEHWPHTLSNMSGCICFVCNPHTNKGYENSQYAKEECKSIIRIHDFKLVGRIVLVCCTITFGDTSWGTGLGFSNGWLYLCRLLLGKEIFKAPWVSYIVSQLHFGLKSEDKSTNLHFQGAVITWCPQAKVRNFVIGATNIIHRFFFLQMVSKLQKYQGRVTSQFAGLTSPNLHEATRMVWPGQYKRQKYLEERGENEEE